MPLIRYVGPIVGVDIVLVNLSGVEPGDEFEASLEAAEVLLSDDTMYVPADDDAAAIVEELLAAEQARADAAAAELAAAETEAQAAALGVDVASLDADPALEG